MPDPNPINAGNSPFLANLFRQASGQTTSTANTSNLPRFTSQNNQEEAKTTAARIGNF
jgi:hypothetical protein